MQAGGALSLGRRAVWSLGCWAVGRQGCLGRSVVAWGRKIVGSLGHWVARSQGRWTVELDCFCVVGVAWSLGRWVVKPLGCWVGWLVGSLGR